ncbi:hypothetical protein MJO29_006075, partial [Puccinia striiformis f. sp. tritici]
RASASPLELKPESTQLDRLDWCRSPAHGHRDRWRPFRVTAVAHITYRPHVPPVPSHGCYSWPHVAPVPSHMWRLRAGVMNGKYGGGRPLQ